MRTCGIALCLIFSMIHLIYSREYARPSPTDMPYSQRDILNKKENMKAYIKSLKSFKIEGPELDDTDGMGHLLVEDERIRIPSSVRGLSEVTKMYLDQNRLGRYLRILDMELKSTPATIELDSSKIIEYVRMLNTINKHKGKSADLVSRSRIKLMKGGITDNIMYDEKDFDQEADYYHDDCLVDKRDTQGIRNMSNSLYASADKNDLFFNSKLAGKKPEENFSQDLGSQKSIDSDLDQSKSSSDIAANHYIENENYGFESDLGNQLLDANIKQDKNEKKTNKFTGEEFYNNAEPLEEEWIENLQIQPSGATEYSGLASLRVEIDPQESAGNNVEIDLSKKFVVGDYNEKPVSNNWSFENEKSKDQSLFDSPFDMPVPINHVISKDTGAHDENSANINSKRETGLVFPKPEERIKQEEINQENASRLKLIGAVNGIGSVGGSMKDINRGTLGSILNNLQNKLYNMRPVSRLSQIADTSNNVPSLNNLHFLQNMYRNIGFGNAIDIKTSAFFQNHSLLNISSTELPFISENISNGPSDHKIFPLKPGDEILSVPKMKYFEQCFNGESNNYQFSHGMPTKPPRMFSNYYISRLKKFEKYNDDSGTLNFLKQPRMPLFGTKENEVSKILNVNLDHLHIDKGALFKIIGKALKVDEEHTQNYAPPKWLEHKYEELLHASHRGQNFNDYDFIERSRHNMNHNDRFNIRDRKESVYERNCTRL
ncbi:uncharacterized protein [Halyomorpha halys]|uniref:uncharacterized protein n=1 Tax=Halyomorpha halys TaxID=286706 RepID=UPI0006D51ACC|nr:uncharacterized protein LOC106684816 [Halyomorpha halys]